MWYVITAMIAAAFGFLVCGLLAASKYTEEQELREIIFCKEQAIERLTAQCESLEREIMERRVEEIGEDVR